MSVRTLEELRADQSAILAEYRSRFTEASAAGVDSAGPPAVVAKVSDVVTSDPDYGAHLVVAPQEFAGTPRAAQAASKPSVRAYPTPNRVVSDYAVDEYVLLATTRGASLAVKLG